MTDTRPARPGAGGVGAAVRRAAERLAAAGVPSPEVDAALLAGHVLGVPRTRVATVDSFDPAQAAEFERLVVAREQRFPLQHLTGRAPFRRLDLEVGPGVFVPRPESEVLVEWAVARLAEWPLDRLPVVVDLCTGSGVIALAVATEARPCLMHAVELDSGALAWAERNLSGTDVVLHQGDVAEALPELDGGVDLVVSNPPYVPDGDRGLVSVEAREHEPALALWAGADGLDVIRTVERAARRLLRPGALVGIEHHDDQGRAVPGLLEAAGGWLEVQDHPDLAGRDRFTTARKA